MALYTYIVGPNPKRLSGEHDRGITPGKVLWSRHSATEPDCDNEIPVYADHSLTLHLGYANVDCLFGGDMPDLPMLPEAVPSVPESAITPRAFEAAALVFGVDLSLSFLRVFDSVGVEGLIRLLALSAVIQREVDA